MFLPQTLDEYLDNPMGKGSGAIGNRNLIKSDLDNRYNNLITKHKDFKHYHYHDNDSFYIHIKIPSESDRNNEYDVVIQFVPTEKEVMNDISLNRYTLKVFSNCPSFTYTYAYVYNEYGIMIDFLRDKYKDIILTDNPIIKNPGEVINFEKSVYFACKYIKSNKSFMNKLTLVTISKRLNINQFKKNIKSSDTIELEIKKENNRLKEIKKKETEKGNRSKTETAANKIAGKTKSRQNHKITPHSKIKGKPKVKSTVKK